MKAGNYIGISFLILGFIFSGLTIERHISFEIFTNKMEINNSMDNVNTYVSNLNEVEHMLNLKLIYLALASVFILIGVSTLLYMKANNNKSNNYTIT